MAINTRLPSVAAENPIGEWQTFDTTLLDRHVTVVLNGKTIIDNQPVLGCTGGAMTSDELKPGPIYLQGDHTHIDYRNNALAQAEAKERQAGSKGDAAAAEERAYAEVAKGVGLDVRKLREELPKFAAQLRHAPDTTTFERANAAYVTKEYPEAERLAMQAVDESLRGNPPRTADAIAAFELAGWSAEKRIQFADALQHFRDAEKLTDRTQDPLAWVRVQYDIAWAFYDDGKYREAEPILRSVWKERERPLGANHPDSLTARHYVARSVWAQGRFSEAESEHRQIVELRTKILGPEHPDTWASRNNLALVLDAQGKHAEAEQEHRAVLAIQERVLGAEHPDTLRSCINLAVALKDQDKFKDALEFAIRAEGGRKRVPGKDHPDYKVALKIRELIEADVKKQQAPGKQ